ncbi:hypothetical protein AB7M22_005283 [Pseudomonas sp. ADAK2 TE3594]
MGRQGQEMFTFDIVGCCFREAQTCQYVGQRFEVVAMGDQSPSVRVPYRRRKHGFVGVDVLFGKAFLQGFLQKLRGGIMKCRAAAGLIDQATFSQQR